MKPQKMRTTGIDQNVLWYWA